MTNQSRRMRCWLMGHEWSNWKLMRPEDKYKHAYHWIRECRRCEKLQSQWSIL
jgi:hypothetical protein